MEAAARARAGRWFGYVYDVELAGFARANDWGLVSIPGRGLVNPADPVEAGVAEFSRGFPAWAAAQRWTCGRLSARRQAAYDRFTAWDRALRLAERLPVDGVAWQVPAADSGE